MKLKVRVRAPAYPRHQASLAEHAPRVFLASAMMVSGAVNRFSEGSPKVISVMTITYPPVPPMRHI
jgi:hypothetical protein